MYASNKYKQIMDSKFDNSISKKSDVDDLINWANELPDDFD